MTGPTASTWDDLVVSHRLAPGYSPDRYRVDAEPRGEGLLMVSVVERPPLEAAMAKRIRKAARRGASGYARHNATPQREADRDRKRARQVEIAKAQAEAQQRVRALMSKRFPALAALAALGVGR
jgi:hypothetical protein